MVTSVAERICALDVSGTHIHQQTFLVYYIILLNFICVAGGIMRHSIQIIATALSNNGILRCRMYEEHIYALHLYKTDIDLISEQMKIFRYYIGTYSNCKLVFTVSNDFLLWKNKN